MQIRYLKNESVEKESNCGEEQRKERDDHEIFVGWIGFVFPVEGLDVLDQIHVRIFLVPNRSPETKRLASVYARSYDLIPLFLSLVSLSKKII